MKNRESVTACERALVAVQHGDIDTRKCRILVTPLVTKFGKRHN
jgi:hypothetical protein